MNKKLLALALSGAFALPMAAQAETTLYGQFNLSYDSIKRGTDVAGTSTSNPDRSANFNGLANNNSRLGVKGVEALGGGLNAVYQVESGLNAAAGNNSTSDASATQGFGTLASRNTFAGFNNKTFGTFWAGRQDTPYKRATGTWDFFNETIGDMNNVISNPQAAYGVSPTAGTTAALGAASYGSFHQRLNRSIGYDGAWGGLYLDLQAGTQSQVAAGVVGGTPKFSTYSGLIGYRFAGFDVNYSAEQNRANVPVAPTGPTTTFTKAKAQQVGVAYTLPAQYMAAQLGAVYEKIDTDVAGFNNQKNWWVGAAVPFLVNNKFGISYGKAGSTATGANPANGAKLAAIGASHNFTKNTSVYAVYAQVRNDAGGAYGLNTDHGDVSNEYSPVGPRVAGVFGAGQKVRGVSVGLLTKF